MDPQPPGKIQIGNDVSTEMEILGSGKRLNTPSDADQPRSQKARAVDEYISASGEGHVGTAGGHLGLIFRSHIH